MADDRDQELLAVLEELLEHVLVQGKRGGVSVSWDEDAHVVLSDALQQAAATANKETR